MNITIALAGNPNSGKTTLFNALTGAHQYVGNWPGVTVERKEARFLLNGDEALLVDLPGVYSLSPYSIEEKITRHFIAQHSPDVVLNIVDATNIERNLYLTFQLMELERPMVVALNMMDEFEAGGGKIDCARLGKALGAPVIPISAKKKRGFDELFAAIHEEAQKASAADAYRLYDRETQRAVAEITAALGGVDSHSAFDMEEHDAHRDHRERDDDHPSDAPHRHIGGYVDQGDIDFAPPAKWVALKMLEGDASMKASANLTDKQRERIDGIVARYIEAGQKIYPEIDGMSLIASCRYAAIEGLLRGNLVLPRSADGKDITGRIDKIVTHKVLAFPLFLLVMGLMFALTFGPVGAFLCELMEVLVNDVVGAGLRSLLLAGDVPEWMHSLVLDGIVAGVGGVLTFLPQILLIFLCLSMLEDSGYMARAAFITDRLFRKLGLSGRSFIPMLMGFGCTTTAVIAARGVENERDRRMTIMLTPYMSCGAKLPVYGVVAASLFPSHQALAVFSLYLMGMLVMVILGLILRKTTFKEGETPFVMELPPYRVPSAPNVLKRLWIRAKDFLLRAGTLIFLLSIVIWVLQSFTPGLTYTTSSEESVFGAIGRFIAPVFSPLGFGEWRKAVALLSGFVAKEAVVSTLSVLYSAADSTQLTLALASRFTPVSAYSFLVFILLYPPCVAAIASIAREMGNRKYTLMTIGLQFLTAYGAAFIVRWAGELLVRVL